MGAFSDNTEMFWNILLDEIYVELRAVDIR